MAVAVTQLSQQESPRAGQPPVGPSEGRGSAGGGPQLPPILAGSQWSRGTFAEQTQERNFLRRPTVT